MIAGVATRAQRAGWAEHARQELRRAGHRSGGARAAVLDQMAGQDCCLTAQEIFAKAALVDYGLVAGYQAGAQLIDAEEALKSAFSSWRRLKLSGPGLRKYCAFAAETE